MPKLLERRLNDKEALEMLHSMPTPELMALAHARKSELHENKTFYVHSHNLNPTNICVAECDLCSFWRKKGTKDAYVTSLAEAEKELEKATNGNLTDLHIVGGMIPELDLNYYESLFSLARKKLPGVLLQGMTAVEIHWIATQAGLSIQETLERLKAAGFGSISGGGAEIFHPDIREKIAPKKITADQWLEVHRTAHKLGIPSNATMLFGHIEQDEHVIDHLSRLRALQDETKGFLAAIPLPFQANGKTLGVNDNPSGDRQVRIAAFSRLYLDNIPHIRMLVNYMDRKLLSVLMHSGVDDIGGTSLNERIAKAAGAPQSQKFFSGEEMEQFIRDAGFEPTLTNSIYQTSNLQAQQTTNTTSFHSQKRLGGDTLKRIEAGKRLTKKEAIVLYKKAPLSTLGNIAALKRQAIVPGDNATYIIDKNLNITNICTTQCTFCAFHVSPEDPRSYTRTIEQITETVKQAAKKGATQILIQGGLNPELSLNYYEKLLSSIRDQVDIWIHSLSPTEIDFLSKQEKISARECLIRLKAAGLQSLPGGGAEILVDEVRQRISPKKTTAKKWLKIMEIAHQLDLKSTATMVYGFGETVDQRLEHLQKIRDLQDRTGGFTAFIPWSFSANKTELKDERAQNGADYLRMIALARLFLDNIPHVQAGWVTEGPDVAQLALQFGADDFGGVLMTEEVVSATGLTYRVNEARVQHLIREAGWQPTQRTTQYETIAL